MAKLTRKSYQRKAMVVGATAFAGIALVATGFAAWVISSSATKNVQGGVHVGTISEKSVTISDVTFKAPGEGDSRDFFSFEPDQNDKSGRVRCDGENWENLSLKVTGKYSPADYVNSFSIALRMGSVSGDAFTPDADDEKQLEAAQTAGYITLPDCWTGGSVIKANPEAKGVTVKTNGADVTDSESGMKITIAEEGTEKKKVATFEYTISFEWGAHFNKMNPSLYYDTKEGKDAHPGDDYKTDLGKFFTAMTGQPYTPGTETAKAYEEMPFAIIVTADTTGAAA